MPANSLEWFFKIVDRMSGPSKQIEKALGQVDRQLREADKATKQIDATMGKLEKQMLATGNAAKRMRNEFQKAQPPAWMRDIMRRQAISKKGTLLSGLGGGPSVQVSKQLTDPGGLLLALPQLRRPLPRTSAISQLGGLSNSLSSIGATASGILFPLMLVQNAISGIARVAGTAMSALIGFAKFGIGAAAGKERTMRGLNTFLGGEGQAMFGFAETERFAEQFAQPIAQVQDQFVNLLSRGFKRDEAFKFQQAIADIRSQVNIDEGGARELINAIAQIRSKGVASMEEIGQQLGEKADIGAILDQIAVGRGIEQGITGQMKVRKLIEQRQVTAQEALSAFLRFVSKNFDKGGPLGTAAEQAAKTMDGLQKTIVDRPNRFAMRLDLGPLKSKYTEFLQSVVTITDPNGPFGKRIISVLEQTFGLLDSFLDRYTGDTGAKRLAEDLNRILSIMEDMLVVAKPLAQILSFGLNVGATAALGPTESTPLGERLAGGFAKSAVTSAIPGAGFLSTASDVAGALFGSGPRTSELTAGGRGGGRGDVTVNVAVESGAGDEESKADLAAMIGDEVKAAVSTAVEDLATEAGAF